MGRQPELLRYTVAIPADGKYEFTARVRTVTVNRQFLLRVNQRMRVDVDIHYNRADWMETEPVELNLKEGRNRISMPQKAPNKGLSIKEFNLKPVN